MNKQHEDILNKINKIHMKRRILNIREEKLQKKRLDLEKVSDIN